MALIKVKDLVAKKVDWEEVTIIDLVVDGRKLTTSIGTAAREYGERNVSFFTDWTIEVMETAHDYKSAGELMDIYAANMDWTSDTIITIHDGGKVLSMPAAAILRELMHEKVRYFYGNDVILLPKHGEED